MADLTTKKFLDQAGTTYLWKKIAAELEKKGAVASVSAADDSVVVAGTAATPTVGVQISNKAGNSLEVLSADGEKGLYVNVPVAAEYGLIKDETSSDYAAVYHLQKGGVNVGAEINIPKDMVVSSGSVVTDPAGQPAGTYIELVLANADNDKLYINVGDLIEYVTGAAAADNIITISVDANHVATATIADGSIPATKLTTAVQTSLNNADSALQAADIVTGTQNGTIKVKGSDVAVAGLGSAAFEATGAFATAAQGALADTAVQPGDLGTAAKASTTDFDAAGSADAVYAAIQALTTDEIDAAIASANAQA